MTARPYTPRPGSRVFWSGSVPFIFQPESLRLGTVVRTGTIRHEVRWDDRPDDVVLVSVGFVRPIREAEAILGRKVK